MPNIRDDMPVLVRHEGQWAGRYITSNNDGDVIDQHASLITCEFPEDKDYPYFQTNRYEWSDQKIEEYHFPGTYRDNALWFDTERIEGKAWEADDSIIILYFSYKGVPEAYVYELIHISPCNHHRARTWHWFRHGEIYQRTLIKETRVR